MHIHSNLIILGFLVMLTSACDQKAPSTPPPGAAQIQIQSDSSPTSVTPTGVPSADSVLGAASQAKPVAPAGRPNSAMTSAQESSGMPIPGQNNDHSAPLATAKPASKP